MLKIVEGGEPDFGRFRKEVKKRMVELEIGSIDQLAKKMGASAPSLRRWMKNPADMRIKDFVKLMDALMLLELEREELAGEIIKKTQKERRAI